jgi:hypothetical protein
MTNTSARKVDVDDDLAKAYATLDNGTYHLRSPVRVDEATIMCLAQGLRSTVDDMLKWCGTLNKAYKQESTGVPASSNLTLRRIRDQWTKVTPMPEPFAASSWYGLGWVHAQLPAVLGAIGCNPGFVQSMPLVCRGSNETIMYHQGSMAGYISSLFLIPGISSAIVVPSNSISLNDCADWVSPALLEALSDIDNRTYSRKYAKESADAQIAKFPGMAKSLEEKLNPGTIPRTLDNGVGKYYNEIGGFSIEIRRSTHPEHLQLAFRGLGSQKWNLKHYHHDSFIWLITQDEAVSKARFSYSPEKLYAGSLPERFSVLQDS